MSLTFTEHYPEVDGALSLRIRNILVDRQSPFQNVKVVESTRFGRVLLIDDLVMLTDRDEFVYHEMIAHVPLFTHPDPRRVLVIGGGDGGTVRECLRHPSVEHVDLVDIDRVVTEVCLEYFPDIAAKLLSERVTCRFQDGVRFVKECRERYDVIIIDSTDPVSVGEGLFTGEFYRDCYNLLEADGLLVAQSESPSWLPKLVRRIHGKLTDIFPRVRFYQAFIPTYPSGHWTFCLASRRHDPVDGFQSDRYAELGLSFRYYNDGIHRAAFALPTFFQELIDEV